MEENFEESFNIGRLLEEDLYNNTEKNIDYENINQDEQNNVNTHVNNGLHAQLNLNNNINYNNENYYYNQHIYISSNNEKLNQNLIDNNFPNENDLNNNNKNLIFNVNGAGLNEGDIFQGNLQKLEQIENKKTCNSSNITVNLNGKQINTSNDVVSCALNEYFHTNEINLTNKVNDMQFLKKKKKRRTKKEVLKEKLLKSKEIKIKKKLGRKKFEKKEIKIKSSEHSKLEDDNMIKKINSFYMESTRNWLNNSFIDENGNFVTIESRKKSKKTLFLKIPPNIITTNLKKETAMKIMNEKFKNIFSNKISEKYKKIDKNQNKNLIEEIYENNDQIYIRFILEKTFIELFNYFNGQKNFEDSKKYFTDKNIDECHINQFFNNFNKIEHFLLDIKKKEENGNLSKEMVQDYAQRISLLCLNYKEWFEGKYKRAPNKKKEKKV